MRALTTNSNHLRCPQCRQSLVAPVLEPDAMPYGVASCENCSREYAHYCGVIDLRSDVSPTCFMGARTIAEGVLVGQLTDAFHTGTLRDLIDIYVRSHKLPDHILEGDRRYLENAHEREAWSATYMEFCFQRYAGRSLHGNLALEAGCGSGGMLPHFARRFDHTVGIDVDLPSLLIAARRCIDLGIQGRVTLVAAQLEQNVLAENMFDVIKCTDVIEHVDDPDIACRNLVSALAPAGTLFMLTPNKWSPWSPEPHVGLWGVQFLPIRMADWYVQKRIGVRYSDVTRLMSYREFMRTLRRAGTRIVFIPVEDKYFNPGSRRGASLKNAFNHAPLRWLSRIARPLQPSLEALCFKVR